MRPVWALIPGWTLAIGIVVGNGLLIFLITARRNLRTTTNWFVLSLAVADFGVGAVWYPRLSFCSIRDETCVNDAVAIAYSFGCFCAYSSVTNLCALTLDRYLAIVHPLRYVAFMTKKRVALLVSAAWGVALVIFISLIAMFFALTGESQKLLSYLIWLYATGITLPACVFLLFATVRIVLVGRRICDTERRGHCPAELQPQSRARSGVQGAGNCVSENDRNRGDGVSRLLLVGYDWLGSPHCWIFSTTNCARNKSLVHTTEFRSKPSRIRVSQERNEEGT